MSNYTYYEGVLELEDSSWAETKDKVTLSYHCTENWERVKGRSISCGEEDVFKVTRRLGIRETEREELSSMLKSSLGVKDLASIKSHISTKSGIEVTKEAFFEESEEKKITAPKCKRKHIIIYQLVRDHHFSLTDKRFFSFNKGKQKVVVREYLDEVWTSVPTFPDPECNCDEPEEDDGIMTLLLNNLGLTTSFKKSDRGMYVEALETRLSTGESSDLLNTDSGINMAVKSLPEYLSYLANFQEENIQVQLTSIEEFNRTHERLKFNLLADEDESFQFPAGVKVIVVDDSVTVQRVVTRLLLKQGMQVVTARDGVEALEKLLDFEPDFMIVDTMMPRMDGITLVKTLRQTTRFKNIPVAMSGGGLQSSLLQQATLLGIDLLSEPFSIQSLVKEGTGIIKKLTA